LRAPARTLDEGVVPAQALGVEADQPLHDDPPAVVGLEVDAPFADRVDRMV
jgi:hypothetical protein